MTKYHISKRGTVEICRATVRPCPLGGGHFNNKDDAYAYVEEKFKLQDDYQSHILYETQYKTIDANKRSDFVNKETKYALKNGMSTIDMYYDRNKREWSKERQAIHREIINEIMEKYKNVPNDKKVMFSAGLPGAGKTTVLTKYEKLNMNDWATVSSDDIKELLAKKGHVPEIEGLTPMESSTLVHKESSYLSDKILYKLGQQNKNIIYDFTCKSTRSAKKRIDVLKGFNYEEKNMQFVFVDITPEIASERAKYRYVKGLNEGIQNEIDIKNGLSNKKTIGGRHLPQSAIDALKPKGDVHSSKNAEAVIEIHEKIYPGLPKPKVYDNTGNEPVEVKYNNFWGKLPKL